MRIMRKKYSIAKFKNDKNIIVITHINKYLSIFDRVYHLKNSTNLMKSTKLNCLYVGCGTHRLKGFIMQK